MCPVPAENKEIVIAGKIAMIKFMAGRQLLESPVFQRRANTDYRNFGFHLGYSICIGSDYISIQDFRHHEDDTLSSTYCPEIVMEDSGFHGVVLPL
jgi:hypothetical protein